MYVDQMIPMGCQIIYFIAGEKAINTLLQFHFQNIVENKLSICWSNIINKIILDFIETIVLQWWEETHDKCNLSTWS